MRYDERVNELRRRLTYGRKAFDIILFLWGDESFEIALRDRTQIGLHGIVHGIVTRCDPYKAPEQIEPDIRRIVSFIAEELYS